MTKTVTSIIGYDKLPRICEFTIDSNPTPVQVGGELKEQLGYIRDVALITGAWGTAANFTVYLYSKDGLQATQLFMTRAEAFEAVNTHLQSLELPEIEDGIKSPRRNFIHQGTVEVYEREEEPLKSFTACVSYTHEDYPTLTKELEFIIEASCEEAVEYLLYNCDSYQNKLAGEGYVFRDVECITL